MPTPVVVLHGLASPLEIFPQQIQAGLGAETLVRGAIIQQLLDVALIDLGSL